MAIPATQPIKLSQDSVIAKLTAPDAHVVLNGPKADAVRALKLAFTQLIASGHLRIDGTRDPRIVVVPGKEKDLPRSLYAVWLTIANYSRTRRNGIPLSDLGQIALSRWGKRGTSYVQKDILPTLYTHGYYAEEWSRAFLLVPTRNTVLTPKGKEARDALQRLQWLARKGPQQMNREVVGGVAGFAALAGTTIFLFDQDGRYLKDLAVTEQRKATTDLGSFSHIDGRAPDAIGHFLSTEWGNLDILGSIDTFFDSFDSFVDSIDSSGGDFGGDSGGDSGGGDSGGGGGE